MLTGKNNDGHSFDLAHMFKLSRFLAAWLSFPLHKQRGRKTESQSLKATMSSYIDTQITFFFAG